MVTRVIHFWHTRCCIMRALEQVNWTLTINARVRVRHVLSIKYFPVEIQCYGVAALQSLRFRFGETRERGTWTRSFYTIFEINETRASSIVVSYRNVSNWNNDEKPTMYFHIIQGDFFPRCLLQCYVQSTFDISTRRLAIYTRRFATPAEWKTF